MRMPSALRPLLACGLAVGFAMLAPAQGLAEDAAAADSAVIATVNGSPVTEGDIKLAEADMGQQFAQLSPEQRRAMALSAIIEIRLLADDFQKSGLADKDDFKRQLAFLRERALHSGFVESKIAPEVTDEAVRALYDKEVAEKPQSEIHARHILVKTKEEAEAIIKELEAGGDFIEIAKAKSTDGAAAQGGDLGYFGPGSMVPAFEEAAFAIEVGGFSKTPVESQFGFHVIKVEDKRPLQPKSFEQEKQRLQTQLFREKYFEAVKNLREAATIDISDPALKDAVGAMNQAK